MSGVGPDEDDALAIAGLDELGVLRQEAVAGMDRIGLGLDRDAQDVLDVEVGVHRRLAATHQVGLVGLGPMQREAVLLRIDGDGADAEFVGGAHDADGDFSAIGDQQAADASQHEMSSSNMIPRGPRSIAAGARRNGRKNTVSSEPAVTIAVLIALSCTWVVRAGDATAPVAGRKNVRDCHSRRSRHPVPRRDDAGPGEGISRGTRRGFERRLRRAGARRLESRCDDRRGACPGGQPVVQRRTRRCPESRRRGRTRCLAHGRQDIERRRRDRTAAREESRSSWRGWSWRNHRTSCWWAPAPRSSRRLQGVEMVPNEYFRTPSRQRQLERSLRGALARENELEAFGTVGAVALDLKGNLAAATSTGGMTGKRWGRVGDSPIIGAGTYANNASCAVSATGHGEYFIRTVVAHDICARVEYLKVPLAAGRGRRAQRQDEGARRQRRRHRHRHRGAKSFSSSTPKECSAACARRRGGTRWPSTASEWGHS